MIKFNNKINRRLEIIIVSLAYKHLKAFKISRLVALRKLRSLTNNSTLETLHYYKMITNKGRCYDNLKQIFVK
jgi:hypothetical protein